MRTTKGSARNRAKKRLFRKTKGYRGARGHLLRSSKVAVLRAGAYAYRDRRVRKLEFRKLFADSQAGPIQYGYKAVPA